MKAIKIGFVDTFDGTADFFVDILKPQYEIERDDNNPDYLFFGDENFGQKNRSMNAKKRIFFTGENRRPWNYPCHHAISFDHLDSPQFYRLPLYVLNMWFLETRLNYPNVMSIERKESEVDHKKGFCGFVNTNPHCNERNDFFQKLSSYQTIDSGGPLFNNIGYVLPRGEDGITKKIEFFSDKKFSIAYENGSYPGYATEKMLEAYYGGTVPIYWGSPTVKLDFNPKCFLNRHDFVTDEDFIDRIKQVNENRSLYLEYYLQPLFVNNEDNEYMDMNKFRRWFDTNVVIK